MMDSKFSFMPPSWPLCTTLTTTLPFVFSLTLLAKSVIARTRMISGLFGDASAASIFCAAAFDAVPPSSAVATASPRPAILPKRFPLIVPSLGRPSRTSPGPEAPS